MDYPKKVLNVGLVNGKFIDEDNDTGQAGSLIPAVWGNAVTDELLAVIRAGGLEPAEMDHDQLQQAIQAIVRGALVQALPSQSMTAFTTTGTAPNYVLSPLPALNGYVANQRFRVKFGGAGVGALTLNVSELGAKSLKQYDATGNKVDTELVAGQLADIEYDGVDFVLLTPLPNGVKASELRQGAAKVATQGQADAGTDDATIITPKKMRWGFYILKAANGGIVFPTWLGGWVVQWGQASFLNVAANGAKTVVTLPFEFPNEPLRVWASAVQDTTYSGWIGPFANLIPGSRSTVLVGGDDVSNAGNIAFSVNWLVIGH